MESYEVQAKSELGWQIIGVFDEYDHAHECAVQLDQDGIYDDLRVTRETEDQRTGRFRASVVYRCGRHVREEIAREDAKKEKLAAVDKRRLRLVKKITPRLTRKSDMEMARRDASSHPFRLAAWATLLVSVGMIALYYFEFVLFDR